MSASLLVKRVAARFRRSVPYRAARFLYKYPTDPAWRSVKWLVWSRPRNLFQPFAVTREDRYPRVFAAMRQRLGNGAQLRLLSFGCATGEEVASLRRIFPNAGIKGLDINARSITACTKKFASDPSLAFAVADSTAHEPAGTYDAILCLAVLRHGGLTAKTERCDHLIRFADFEGQIADFARCLKPGGLLALRHANFRLADTEAAAQFETLLSLPGTAAKFAPDNRRLPDAEREDVLFRKR